jgi:diguanylate cyclase (GGDEF)-like protein
VKRQQGRLLIVLADREIDSFLGTYFPQVEEWEKKKILRWSEAISRKDPYYPDHIESVCQYATTVGLALGLETSDINLLIKGALLHDIGKVSLPSSILSKPGPLSPQERARIHRYPPIGEKLCQSLPSFRDASFLVRSHHERLDGSGYPDGLSGEQIPLLVRILAAADVFDALIHQRVYKPPFTPDAVFSVLAEEAQKGWLDPQVVNQLTRLAQEGRLPAHHADHGSDESKEEGSPYLDKGPVEVLVVEDNEDIRYIMVTMLGAMGYQIHTAANGKEGLELLQQHSAIGIVLLDIMMPEMDGYAFCQKVHATPALKDLHIIIVSARHTPEDKIKGLDLGAADYLTKPFNPAELRARVSVGERIVRQQRALKAQRSLLEKMVREDPLTGLASRRFFEERLREEWARVFRYRRSLSLVIGDLDHFKQINDRYGHSLGDRVLACVGELLRHDLRKSDLAGRYGGEEFVLLLPETDQEGAHLIAERLLAKVKEMIFYHPSGSFSVTMSFGVATAYFPSPFSADEHWFAKSVELPDAATAASPSSPSSPEQLQEWADKALYAAKNAGRNRVELFRPGM